MSDQQASENSDQFEIRANAANHFAWLRTRLALERTMLAWMRTAVSLIGFGFAIVQFLDRFGQMAGVAPPRFPNSARYLGLALIGSGVMVLVLSIWEYRSMLRYLWSENFAAIAGIMAGGKQKLVYQIPLYLASIVIILIGIFAFFVVYQRLV
jgi:putative membrane protein